MLAYTWWQCTEKAQSCDSQSRDTKFSSASGHSSGYYLSVSIFTAIYTFLYRSSSLHALSVSVLPSRSSGFVSLKTLVVVMLFLRREL